MTRFRPCIDLHAGAVKQIVGGTLAVDTHAAASPSLVTNFESGHPASYYAQLYRDHDLNGGHVIMLGPGNEEAALDALHAWPGALQLGGGIRDEKTAQRWLDEGAAKVIVTSCLFPDGRFSKDVLRHLAESVGKNNLVTDVSCRKTAPGAWTVAMNQWQTLTDMQVTEESLCLLAEYSSEFLVHAADVEGLCSGMDEELITRLGRWSPIPCTYAGGGSTINDLNTAERLSGGVVDLTIGSALDIFGGSGVTLAQCAEWNRTRRNNKHTNNKPMM